MAQDNCHGYPVVAVPEEEVEVAVEQLVLWRQELDPESKVHCLYIAELTAPADSKPVAEIRFDLGCSEQALIEPDRHVQFYPVGPFELGD